MTMLNQRARCLMLSGILALAADAITSAQNATTQPADAPTGAATPQPTTLPADAKPITAKVIELKGDVRFAPLGSTDYKPARVGDEFPPETVVLTGLRSSAVLKIGEDDTYTAVVIDPASKTLLSELFVTQEKKQVRIGVGYGQVRAGVVEGGLKSDFTVSSPVATLSKRGTWGFGLYMQRPDTFEIFLLDQGLVDAFDKASGGHRLVLPGELVDKTMKRWAELANRLSNVPMIDVLGQSDVDVAYNRLQQDGLRVLNPEGGSTIILNLSNASAATNFAQLARQALPQNFVSGNNRPNNTGQFDRVRTEGFFGTGRGEQLVPIVILPTSDLAARGYARPGTYNFPRPVVEQWLSQHGK